MSKHDPRRARIAIIGAGWWSTQTHLPTLLANPYAEIVGIADLNADKLRAAGSAYNINSLYTDYRAMLDAEKPDGVIVATNHLAHFDASREALVRGMAVLVEKPMVLRAVEARALQALAEQHSAHLMVGYPWHFTPQHRELRELIAAGRIGQLQMVSTLYASMVVEFLRGNPQSYQSVFNYPVTGPTAATYSDPRIAGGGQGVLQVTHAAALLLWLTGLKPVSVSAFMERHDLRVDLCDAITVRFDNDAIGTIASTGNIARIQTDNQRLDYRLFGTEGYAMLEVIEGTASVYTNDGAIQRLPLTPPDNRYPAECTSQHLVDLVLGRTTVNQSPASVGVRTVELLEASYRSATEGRVIHVDEL